jgi:hypothetical protein
LTITINPGVTINSGLTIRGYTSIVNNGLILKLDAGNSLSYPGSGSSWVDLVSSKVFTLHGSDNPSYYSDDGGYIMFDPGHGHFADAESFPATLDNWTIEAWHYYTGTNSSGSPCIVTEAYAGTPINFTLGNCTDSSPNLQVGHWDGANFNPTPQGIVLTPNTWYQLVGTFDGTAHRLFINGVQVAIQNTTSPALRGGSGIRLMKRWDGDQYWGGALGVVLMYDRAITLNEIAQNYGVLKGRFGLT